MPRSRTPRSRYVQASIEDLNPGTEHITGAVPIDPVEADARRDDFYAQFVAHVEQLKPIACMPDFGVHIYHIGRRFCVCTERSRALADVKKQIEELP